MQVEIGQVYEGVVKGITPYGAFVDLADGVTGMVHISEVANVYVSNIRDHLTENQTVKVKVLSINEAGKISLSIKKACPPPQREQRKPRMVRPVLRTAAAPDRTGVVPMCGNPRSSPLLRSCPLRI